MIEVADFELTAEAAGGTVALQSGELELQLEQHRRELTAYAYRMLASAFDAEDAVQETFIRAWRGYQRFEGRAALRSWLYRITTNVCLDMLNGRERRARPMDLGPAQAPIEANLNTLAGGNVDPAGARRARDGGRGSGRGGRRPRDDPAGVHRRAAAPSTPSAGGVDPLRGASLAGDRGRGAARYERRLGQQRAPARAGHARRRQRELERSVAGADRRRPGAARPLRRGLRDVTTWRRSPL